MFRPWIGSRFGRNHGYVERPNHFGFDVLVVGESHYSDECDRLAEHQADRDFTRRVVQHWGIDAVDDDRYYFKRIARVLCLDPAADGEACANMWEEVAFCNLVQRMMDTREERPRERDFNEGVTALRHTLRTLQPDVVLVTGAAVWGHVEPLVEGATARFGAIYHPAARQFNYADAIETFGALCEDD